MCFLFWLCDSWALYLAPWTELYCNWEKAKVWQGIVVSAVSFSSLPLPISYATNLFRIVNTHPCIRALLLYRMNLLLSRFTVLISGSQASTRVTTVITLLQCNKFRVAWIHEMSKICITSLIVRKMCIKRDEERKIAWIIPFICSDYSSLRNVIWFKLSLNQNYSFFVL